MRNVRHDGVWDIEQEEMMTEFFAGVDAIRYEGPDSPNPLAFHYYDPDRVVLDKTMKEHLRAAVCYWHSFQWPGSDVFGAGTFDRPWLNAAMEPMTAARMKMDAAFEFFSKPFRIESLMSTCRDALFG